MYHIGIVREVVGPAGRKGASGSDRETQAVVKMWDEHLLMLLVDRKLAGTIKPSDYVIADYTPLAPDSPHRKMRVVKVIPKDQGARIWEEFVAEFNRRRNASHEAPQRSPYIR